MKGMDGKGLSRRGFIAGAGMAGVGTVLGMTGMANAQTPSYTPAPASSGGTAGITGVPAGARVPTRPFGKTGQQVSILSMGGMYDIPGNQAMLKKCLDWGVTYWDTANGYGGGKSETGIGMFFEKFPEERKKVFLVTKSGKRDPAGLTQLLETSLQRMKTDHIDLFFVHGISSIKEVNSPETKAWAEKAKADKKIRFFGFSTHSNMEQLLQDAPALGFIDGIMLTYNIHLMDTDRMKRGVEACQKAGIGLTAMKTMAGGPVKPDNAAEMKIADHFLKKGFSQQQAKLKAVWQNEAIAAICSQMPNLAVLTANTAAAVDPSKLADADLRVLREYAAATSGTYCAGCHHLCESAAGCDSAGIADAMRYMMYHTSYGDTHHARQCFAEMGAEARAALASADLGAAQAACPRGLPVADVVREAFQVLG